MDFIGRPVADLDTPAFVVDLPILRRNLARMQTAAERAELAMRPHIKAHKAPALARMQLQAGAVGVTAAKVSEAEAMVDGGVGDVFIANEVVGEAKVDRLATLAERATVSTAFDSVAVAGGYSRVFAERGLTLDVVMEIDTGAGRCGVPPEQAATLALSVSDLPGIRLAGIMAYAGAAYLEAGARGFERAAAAEGEALRQVADALRAEGYAIERVSGGSSPTGLHYRLDGGLTEMRPGTYAFYDMNQVDLGAAWVSWISATILATVISTPGRDRGIVDAGSKSLGTQVTPVSPGCGWVADDLGVVVGKLNDEHGYLDLRRAMRSYEVGDKVRIIPPRVCTAVNLYDELYLVEDGLVVEVCPVTGRGKSR
jgi:D-serine deaminase-like pyridoxal phosphate-dependent protein